ncbi:MAG: flagellar motor switch protein FliM [candidate division Zixibacteria bacterium]|nr:flagellar motor switch protein FliM [candidate division Zixibacteria bacterium]
MAKILSQDEIDALLTTVSSGEVDIDEGQLDDDKLRSVVAYDFKHPNRVSKDQIRTLENLHDNFGGHYGSILSAVLRTIVDVDLVSVDQITYSEFIMSLVSPSCTFTFAAPPLEGGCLVDFNPTLTFSLIDRMFGGSGKTLETERELTGIERTVMARLAAKLYEEIEEAWENIVKIETEQRSFETNPQFIQIVPPGETVVVVSFQIKLFQATGLLTICYPYVSLEPVISKLSAQNWIDATKRKNLESDRSINLANLNLVEADISAVLLRTDIRMRDFLSLKVGDIVPSQHQINEPVVVSVSRAKKFLARPGISGKKRAIQILESLAENSQKSPQESLQESSQEN